MAYPIRIAPLGGTDAGRIAGAAAAKGPVEVRCRIVGPADRLARNIVGGPRVAIVPPL